MAKGGACVRARAPELPGGVCPRLASFVLRPGQWTLKIAREEARAIFSRRGSRPSQFLGQQIWARAVVGEGFTFQGLHPSWVSSPPIAGSASPEKASWGERARSGVGVLGWGKGSSEATFPQAPPLSSPSSCGPVRPGLLLGKEAAFYFGKVLE